MRFIFSSFPFINLQITGVKKSIHTQINKPIDFLISLGHNPTICNEVIKVLQRNGITNNALLPTLQTLAGRWEVGEDNGLNNIILSVKNDIANKLGKSRVTFNITPPGFTNYNRVFSITTYEGMTITDVAKHGGSASAKQLAQYIECACSGVMACSTCHVIVNDKWFDLVGPPDEDEQDMIDLAFKPTPTSRLGCQLVLSKKLDGLLIHLPTHTNNIMDNIPFQN